MIIIKKQIRQSLKVDSYPEFQKMALPTYNVNYIEIVKNGLKAVELWEDGGFKYSKNRQREDKIYFRCNKARKVGCTVQYIYM